MCIVPCSAHAHPLIWYLIVMRSVILVGAVAVVFLTRTVDLVGDDANGAFRSI